MSASGPENAVCVDVVLHTKSGKYIFEIKTPGGEAQEIARPLSPAALFSHKITDGALRTLWILAYLADEHGRLLAQTQDLARLTGRQERLLQRHYRELERAGYLKLERLRPRTRFFVGNSLVAEGEHTAVQAA